MKKFYENDVKFWRGEEIYEGKYDDVFIKEKRCLLVDMWELFFEFYINVMFFEEYEDEEMFEERNKVVIFEKRVVLVSISKFFD